MSPLETYQEQKRSGAYHPKTEEVWPSKPESSEETIKIPVFEIEPPVNRVPKVEPPKENVLGNLMKKPTALFWVLIANITWIAIASYILYSLWQGLQAVKAEAPPAVVTKEVVKEVPKVVTKTKTVQPKDYRKAKEDLATAKERIRLLTQEIERIEKQNVLCHRYRDAQACQFMWDLAKKTL